MMIGILHWFLFFRYITHGNCRVCLSITGIWSMFNLNGQKDFEFAQVKQKYIRINE